VIESTPTQREHRRAVLGRAVVKAPLACLLSIVLWPCPPPATAVTDCSRTATNIDRLLCSSDRLAVAEQIMAAAFRDAFYRAQDRDALIKEQEQWRKNVRDACNDVPCLLEAYQRRTSELETY
jgi:uncharacterized protein